MSSLDSFHPTFGSRQNLDSISLGGPIGPNDRLSLRLARATQRHNAAAPSIDVDEELNRSTFCRFLVERRGILENDAQTYWSLISNDLRSDLDHAFRFLDSIDGRSFAYTKKIEQEISTALSDFVKWRAAMVACPAYHRLCEAPVYPDEVLDFCREHAISPLSDAWKGETEHGLERKDPGDVNESEPEIEWFDYPGGYPLTDEVSQFNGLVEISNEPGPAALPALQKLLQTLVELKSTQLSEKVICYIASQLDAQRYAIVATNSAEDNYSGLENVVLRSRRSISYTLKELLWDSEAIPLFERTTAMLLEAAKQGCDFRLLDLFPVPNYYFLPDMVGQALEISKICKRERIPVDQVISIADCVSQRERTTLFAVITKEPSVLVLTQRLKSAGLSAPVAAELVFDSEWSRGGRAPNGESIIGWAIPLLERGACRSALTRLYVNDRELLQCPIRREAAFVIVANATFAAEMVRGLTEIPEDGRAFRTQLMLRLASIRDQQKVIRVIARINGLSLDQLHGAVDPLGEAATDEAVCLAIEKIKIYSGADREAPSLPNVAPVVRVWTSELAAMLGDQGVGEAEERVAQLRRVMGSGFSNLRLVMRLAGGEVRRFVDTIEPLLATDSGRILITNTSLLDRFLSMDCSADERYERLVHQCLHESSNPLRDLRSWLFPGEERIIPLQYTPTAELESALARELRQVTPQKVIVCRTFLTDEICSGVREALGDIPVEFIDTDHSRRARPEQFQPGTVVVFCTKFASHSSYRKIKEYALRGGAQFYHCSANGTKLLCDALSQIRR